MVHKSRSPELRTRGQKELQGHNTTVPTPAPSKSPIPPRTVVALLALKFQLAFKVDGRLRRPLKVGIFHDLVAAVGDSATAAEVKAAIHFYASGTGYLRALTEGADRIDLGGIPVGKVTAEEAEHAKRCLSNIKQRMAAKRREKEKLASKPPPEAPAPAPAAPGDSISALRAAWKARGRGGAP
jgi:ProP effector